MVLEWQHILEADTAVALQFTPTSTYCLLLVAAECCQLRGVASRWGLPLAGAPRRLRVSKPIG